LGLIAWFAPFFAYGLLAVPVALAIWLIVKEPQNYKNNQQSTTQYWGRFKNIFKDKGLPMAASFLAGMVVLFILFGVLSWLSDILEQQYRVRGFSVGLLIAIPVGTMAITSYLSGSYFQQVKANFLKIGVIAGLAAVTLATAIISLFANIYVLFLATVLLGFGTGTVLPAVNTLITSAAASEERGLVTCLYGSLRFFGVAVGPPAFGLVTSVGKLPLFISVTAAAAVIAIFALIFIRAEKMLPPQLLQES